jgi:hypothetical protein
VCPFNFVLRELPRVYDRSAISSSFRIAICAPGSIMSSLQDFALGSISLVQATEP